MRGDAGAVSTQSIDSNAGGGFVSVVADTNSGYYRAFGLNHSDQSAGYTDIDYLIELATNGYIYIYENGSLGYNEGQYSVGDVLKVAVVNGVVKYYRNDTLLYTSTVAPTYPLYLDTSLYSPGANLEDALLCAGSDCISSPTTPPYTTHYTFGGKLVGMRRANYPTSGSNGQFRIVGDQLGSTTIIVDTANPPNVVQRQYSKPYGETAWQYTATSSGGSSLTNIGYTGQRTDEQSTGLIFYNARMYDPVLSVFASADTAAPNTTNTMNCNRYAYALNNPPRYSDPTGHCTDDPSNQEDAATRHQTCANAEATLHHYGFIINLDDWTNLSDLLIVIQGIEDMMKAANWSVGDFQAALGIDATHMVHLQNNDQCGLHDACVGDLDNPNASVRAGDLHNGQRYLSISTRNLDIEHNRGSNDYTEQLKSGLVHELAHLWDDACNLCQTKGMARFVTSVQDSTGRTERPPYRDDNPVGKATNDLLSNPNAEGNDGGDDFAKLVAAYVYPKQTAYAGGVRSDYLSSARAAYVSTAMYLASHASQEDGPGTH